MVIIAYVAENLQGYVGDVAGRSNTISAPDALPQIMTWTLREETDCC